MVGATHAALGNITGPGDVAARLALAPFTTSEVMRSLEPIGVDRWALELNLKHGMRASSGAQLAVVGFLPIGHQR